MNYTRKENDHRRYEENRDAILIRQRATYRKRIEKMQVIKVMSGCAVCGEKHPACLDFHHRDGKEKSFTINQAIARSKSWERVLEEIGKCDIMCANCHRKLHWEQKCKKMAAKDADLERQSREELLAVTTNPEIKKILEEKLKDDALSA